MRVNISDVFAALKSSVSEPAVTESLWLCFLPKIVPLSPASSFGFSLKPLEVCHWPTGNCTKVVGLPVLGDVEAERSYRVLNAQERWLKSTRENFCVHSVQPYFCNSMQLVCFVVVIFFAVLPPLGGWQWLQCGTFPQGVVRRAGPHGSTAWSGG